MLTAFYVTQKDDNEPVVCAPVLFELVLRTLIFSIIKTRKTVRKSPITKNEMMKEMISRTCGMVATPSAVLGYSFKDLSIKFTLTQSLGSCRVTVVLYPSVCRTNDE